MASSNERSEMSGTNQQTNSTRQQTNQYPPYQARPPRNSRTVRDMASEPVRENTQEFIEGLQSRQQQDKQQQQQQQQPKDRQQRKPETNDNDDEPQRLSLAELFSDDSGHEDDQNNNGQGSIDSIDGVSKRLGLKPEQVYAIKVPMPNGAEPLTIGELKDRVGELVDLETREAHFEQRRIKSEGELLRAQTEMREILGLLPKELLPQVQPLVDKMRKRHEATMKRERALTLEHIPEWENETTRQEDIQGMMDLMSDYGFDESFITTVTDHRALKFIRDAYLRDKRIKAALAKVTIPNKRGKKPSGKTGKAATKPNVTSPTTRTTGAADPRSRIIQLFNQSSE